jgi:hypothetical protein
MKICVFDTETINVEHPYCYNVGFVIYDTETAKVVIKKEYVIEQVWHNPMLFSTAYYAEKRPLYVSRMKGRKVKMTKWGLCCREMYSIFKTLDVKLAYAYNAPFDEKVFNFNCDFFHTINPFDNIPIIDIMPFVHNKIAFADDFQAFCEEHKLFTETGNYSTNAETVTKYITDNADFIEEHTALADSEIELAILLECICRGCEWEGEYKRYRTIPRKANKTLTVIEKSSDFMQTTEFVYDTIRINKDKTEITLTVRK